MSGPRYTAVVLLCGIVLTGCGDDGPSRDDDLRAACQAMKDASLTIADHPGPDRPPLGGPDANAVRAWQQRLAATMSKHAAVLPRLGVGSGPDTQFVRDFGSFYASVFTIAGLEPQEPIEGRGPMTSAVVAQRCDELGVPLTPRASPTAR